MFKTSRVDKARRVFMFPEIGRQASPNGPKIRQDQLLMTDPNAALVLADGTVFWARGIGAAGQAVGEVCFNTAITGYQEILTDPSYAGQIITFTFPHIGNVGTNREDIETTTPAARGLVVRTAPTETANYRAEKSIDAWLKSYG